MAKKKLESAATVWDGASEGREISYGRYTNRVCSSCRERCLGELDSKIQHKCLPLYTIPLQFSMNSSLSVPSVARSLWMRRLTIDGTAFPEA